MGSLHARQRIGIEQDHEQHFKNGINLENSKLLRLALRGVLKLSGLYWLGCRNTERIEVRHNQVISTALPRSFDGFTVLHISDPHVDMNERAMRRLAEVLPSLDYDLCVITGDFRGESCGPCDAAIEGMLGLRPHLKDPVFGVLGNHDSARMIPALEGMGIRLLLNESLAIERGGSRIHLAGIDDAHLYRLENFEHAVAAIPPDEFSILLSHTPEVYRQAAHANFDFFLAGHTHGGQICLPGSVPIKLEAKLPRRLGAGAWRHNKMDGYTSVGVGSCVIAVRLNCPPEITLHHLKSTR